MKTKTDRSTRALLLYLRLNAQAMQYTPLSPQGLRAARLMPRLSKILDGAA